MIIKYGRSEIMRTSRLGPSVKSLSSLRCNQMSSIVILASPLLDHSLWLQSHLIITPWYLFVLPPQSSAKPDRSNVFSIFWKLPECSLRRASGNFPYRDKVSGSNYVGEGNNISKWRINLESRKKKNITK